MKMLGKTHKSGPGGHGCTCCYPAPSKRKGMNKAQRQREARQWRRELHTV